MSLSFASNSTTYRLLVSQLFLQLLEQMQNYDKEIVLYFKEIAKNHIRKIIPEGQIIFFKRYKTTMELTIE